MKLLTEKRREFNLENLLAFHDYVEVFDKVKRDKLFEILQNKNIPKLLLIKYNRNLLWKQNKVTINNKLSEEHSINPYPCPISPIPFYHLHHEITVKWDQIYTKSITSSVST